MDIVARMYADRDEEGREKVRNYRKPPARFRASEMSACKRQIWYRHSGYIPAPRTGFADDWGIDGDVHHDVVRQLMLAHNIPMAGIYQDDDGHTHEDAFVKHDFIVDGRTITASTRQDGWIKHPEYGWMILEIKSVGHWIYYYMNKAYQSGYEDAHGVKHEPGEGALLAYIKDKKQSYVAQVHVGMAIAKDRGEKYLPFDPSEKYTLDKAYVLLKDRSNCHIGMHGDLPIIGGPIVPFDQKYWDKLLRRAYIVRGKVVEGVPPLAEYPAGSKECGYCAFRYLCHDATKRRAKGESPFVVYPDPEVKIEFDQEDGSE